MHVWVCVWERRGEVKGHAQSRTHISLSYTHTHTHTSGRSKPLNRGNICYGVLRQTASHGSDLLMGLVHDPHIDQETDGADTDTGSGSYPVAAARALYSTSLALVADKLIDLAVGSIGYSSISAYIATWNPSPFVFTWVSLAGSHENNMVVLWRGKPGRCRWHRAATFMCGNEAQFPHISYKMLMVIWTAGSPCFIWLLTACLTTPLGQSHTG